MAFLKKTLGLILTLLGGLVTLACVLCAAMNLIGLISGGLELAVGFLAVGAGAYGVLRMGLRMKNGAAPKKKPAGTRPVQQTPVPPENKQPADGPLADKRSGKLTGQAAPVCEDLGLKREYRLRQGPCRYDAMLDLLQTAGELAQRVNQVWATEVRGGEERDITEAFRSTGMEARACEALWREQKVIRLSAVFPNLGLTSLTFENGSGFLRLCVQEKTALPWVDDFVDGLLDRAYRRSMAVSGADDV